MSITIPLPTQFKIGATHWFVGQIIDPLGRPKAEQITFDFGYLRFIDGAGLTMLCNTLEWLFARGVAVLFLNHGVSTDASRYLDDCGFFGRYLGTPLNQFSRCRPTTLPAEKVSHANSYEWLENRAAPWMAHKLSTIPEKLQTVKVCMKEIFNNIKDHSSEETGFIHIQHYPARERLCMTISDFGRGIPSVIRQKYQNLNDADAITLAATDGISTKPGTIRLTYQNGVVMENETGRRSEIEITEEMIEAGIKAIAEFDWDAGGFDSAAVTIFARMLAAASHKVVLVADNPWLQLPF